MPIRQTRCWLTTVGKNKINQNGIARAKLVSELMDHRFSPTGWRSTIKWLIISRDQSRKRNAKQTRVTYDLSLKLPLFIASCGIRQANQQRRACAPEPSVRTWWSFGCLCGRRVPVQCGDPHRDPVHSFAGTRALFYPVSRAKVA